MSTPVEDVVRRYYRVVGDLSAPEADLDALLAPAARVVEHPNAVTPRGAVRGRDEVLAAFRAGRGLLSAQEFVVDEVLVHGGRAAVRARWSATVGTGRGPFAAGDRLEAAVAAFLTVADGRIVEHETFDCYPPFG
ncbi:MULTISPECIES: nuclear transport factor 2 family protein [unclassified Blastococcus]